MADYPGREPSPADPSSDYEAMLPYWTLARAIMGGLPAMRDAEDAYLPRHEKEAPHAYALRLRHARLTNIFGKTIADLSLRPFTHPVMIHEDTTPALREIAADVDMRRNSLDDFAETLFRAALLDGMTWVLVDQQADVPPMLSVAEERMLGVRPFWRHYGALDVLAAYSDHREGRERLTEIRLREREVVRAGFKEDPRNYIRVFRLDAMGQPEWERWMEVEDRTAKGPSWVLVTGPHTLELEDIPFVPIWFGKRIGMGFQVEPPLRDAAYLQVELYQEENNLKNISNLTAFPMLAANGMQPEFERQGEPKKVTVGPHTVLYGGRMPGQEGGGSWEFVEPAGSSLTFLEGRIEKTIRHLLELGREPLHTPGGNVTRIEAGSATQTSNSLMQALVMREEAAIAQAMQITAEWMNISGAVWGAEIHKEFAVGLSDQDLPTLVTMATAPPPILSREGLLVEAKRRGIIASDFDPEADLVRIIEQLDPDIEQPTTE